MATFERKIYTRMLDWKARYSDRYALLIEGARRVGKTTIVEEFAKREFESYILIDFTTASDETKQWFKDYANDLDTLFRQIQFRYSTRLKNGRSVIIFDEVQSFPQARQLIKHLVKDGRYSYIETGSLISLKQNVEGILIPSEEMHIQMHPLDFEEFLWAQGDTATVDLLRESFRSLKPLGDSTHKQLMGKYITYMLVGGMPQAVEAFIDSNNFDDVETVKRTIIDLYRDDTAKIKFDKGSKARRILDRIPALLSKHDKRFSPSQLKKGSKTRDYFDSVVWLGESKMVNICHDVSDPGPAMGLSIDEHSFKLYMIDTGLLISSSFLSNIDTYEELYDMMLRGRLNMNKGMLLENMVAQELVAKDYELLFCRFHVKETDNPQEVDFLLVKNGMVLPIEVKSGADSTSHISLDRFLIKFKDVADRAYVVHTKDLRIDGNITYLPVYMTMLL